MIVALIKYFAFGLLMALAYSLYIGDNDEYDPSEAESHRYYGENQ